MHSQRHFTVICVLYCMLIFSLLANNVLGSDEDEKKTDDNVPDKNPSVVENEDPPQESPESNADKNDTNVVTEVPALQTHPGMLDLISANQDMLKRAMYVTFAVSGILIVYFGIRFLRARRRKSRRYGRLVTPRRENMELERLASESDEDTVFEARQGLIAS